MEIIIFKFGIIFLMAFLFGIERQLSNKLIGFGTFIFIASGSCALAILALSISSNDGLLTIIGGTLTGIGFIGAGALIKTSDKIFGFTTAASIWIFAILGLAIGFSQYILGTLVYLIVWIVILFDKILEFKGIGSYQRKITIKTNKIVEKDFVLKLLKTYRWKLLGFEIDKKNNQSSVSYLISGPRSYINSLKENLMKQDWVESFKIN
jgi:putative Mg2+ transporter-C (MgtC) family protein